MAEERERSRRARGVVPIPLEPVDLLAGLAPGVELRADEMSSDVEGRPGDGSVVATVAEVGKLVRSGEGTIRRLIRSPGLRPLAPGEESPDADDDAEVERAGVVPRTRTRPGE